MSLNQKETELSFSDQPPCTTDLLFRADSPAFISPDASVLIVGPGINKTAFDGEKPIPMDLATLALAPYLRQGKGKMTILDLPGDSSGFGSHSLPQVMEYFSHVATFLDICLIESIEADIVRSDIQGKYDVINDHLTTDHWIPSSFCDVPNTAESIMRTYWRLLNRGGKLIFHYFQPDSDEDMKKMYGFGKLLEQLDFSIRHISPITDHYDVHFKLRRDLEKSFRHIHNRSSLLTPARKLASYYQSDGILLGIKQ